ncbi:MAG: helix-turn-helix domain-containing protein [Vulcanimicrobiaceae bacterium]
MENGRHGDPRRAELADLLRTRRAALTPERAGLVPTTRRRTPGLRREEVAELAGISVALYTWLEQGRDVPVSAKTIDAIAGALQLSQGERMHAQSLVRRMTSELHEDVTPALRRMVASIRTHPIFVLNHAWDVVLRNAAASAVFDGDFESENNILIRAYLDAHFRALFIEWESVAQSLLEMFRLEYASYPNDQRSVEIVKRLTAESPEFASAWEQHRVRSHPRDVRVITHPVAGELVLEPRTYTVIESPNLRLLLYTPYDDATADKILGLVRSAENESEAKPAG